MSDITLTVETTPATPTSTKSVIFVHSSTKRLCTVDDAGAVAPYVSTDATQTLTNKTLTRPTTTNPAETHQTLTDGATINWNMDSGASAQVTLAAAGRTMAAPTNLRAGATYLLVIIQDATGSRTITTWNAVFKWSGATAPTLSTAASAKDILSFWSDGTNLYGGSLLRDMR